MLCSAVGPVYLIAVLVVLEACVVVHEAIQFLEALVLLLCLKNHNKTPSHRSRTVKQAASVPGSGCSSTSDPVHRRCFYPVSLVGVVPYLFSHLLGLLLHLLDDLVACAAIVTARGRAVLFPFLQADPAEIIFALRGDGGNVNADT